ncbi:TlpA family protein disulfide reductase [Flavobacterium flavigenum]|uniref:TlpA family protein disulfide reductase n=1 Tax=Flavobacterium flavigenum TaxID=3003258 RepID=UPI0022AC59F2|nr:TlpA disulfide reductase family protein [Flavobacterium flavigenum]
MGFKEKEARSIYYLEQKHLLFYKKYHSYYAKLDSFDVSQTYPKFDKTMDLDTNSDFLFSNQYQDIVVQNFYENIKTDEEGNLMYFAKNAIPQIKALKSQSIKNRLIENLSYDINIENESYDKIYHEFLLITNDPILKRKLTANYNAANALQPGNTAPGFNYENQKGGKTSLENLKGKYVYIDLWATWCGPCREEIPFLQKVEEKYKGKNIEFVSISIDAIKDQPKWSKFIVDKKLGGTQLLAENEWESKIMKDYSVQGVPTFILVDPNGNIVTARAPKPSDPKLIELLNSLRI